MICAKKLRIFFAVLALFPQVCECWKVDYGFSSSSILTLLLGATGSSSTADLAAMNSPRHSALGGSGGRSEEAIERLDLSSENLALGYHCCLPLLSLDSSQLVGRHWLRLHFLLLITSHLSIMHSGVVAQVRPPVQRNASAGAHAARRACRSFAYRRTQFRRLNRITIAKRRRLARTSSPSSVTVCPLPLFHHNNIN